MFGSGKISWIYFFVGIISTAFTSFISFKADIIGKKSELLYLSFGFYKHFLKIYLKDFFRSIILLFKLSFSGLIPNLYHVKLNEKYQINKELLIASINMKSGLFCVGEKKDEILIHAISKDCFDRLDIHKLCLGLRNINDDSLV